MHTPDCVQPYFIGQPQFNFSLNVLRLEPVLSYTGAARKPFIPIALLKLVDGAFYRLTPAQHTTFKTFAYDMASDLLQASQQFVDGVLGGQVQVTNSIYQNYLAKMTGDNDFTINRFFQMYIDIAEFYSLAFADANVMNDAITKKIASLLTLGDKTLCLPSGDFYFGDGSSTTPLVNSIIAAEPLFAGFEILELNPL